MENINNKIEEFLERNRGMIIRIARRRLGPFFNEKEAMSIAYLAGLQAKVYKRDQFRKTKDTTVFVWYLQKGFDGIHGLDGGERVGRINGPAYNEESRAIDFERTLSFKSDETLWGGNGRDLKYERHGMEPVTGEACEFCVCIESFKDKAISKRILDTLRLLTHNHSGTQVINELGRMYGCRRKTMLSDKIFKELISEINFMGLKLFKAECMNGVYSIVIACAESDEEANSYLAKYGKVLKCSQLIMSGNTD